MSEPRLDPSDAQISRHAMGQLAESASIMRESLIGQAFFGHLLDDLLLEWWKATITTALAPDLVGDMTKLFNEMRPKEED